ncbi:MAG: hypothetical protein RBU29_12910 [bacterium]|jgi:hypothetical protein|nr:hypothetical protein [bacterium]
MEIGALSQALATQSLMGELVVKVLGQTTQMAQQQALAALEQTLQDQAMQSTAALIEGLGENIDIVA